MHRNARVLWSCVALAGSTLVLPALSGTAFGQSPIRKVEQPSRLTVIRPAPAAACKLLDDPKARQLMDGLLFNLVWSCGRQNEIGRLVGEVESESSEDQLRLVTAAATAGDVRVNNPAGETGSSVTQSETSIAHNPVTGTLCSSFNDSGEFYGGGGGFTGFARSTDGGATWQDNGAVGGISGGDPSLIWRRADGYFYLATLASGGNLALWVSTNDCQTFNQVSTPSTGSDDKEMLAVDNNPSSPNYGNIYLVWNDFGLSSSGTIRAIRSTDGGSTWSTPVTLSGGGTVQGPWPAVAPNGDLFVAWIQYASWPSGNITVQMSRSTNGGLSFSAVTSPLSNAVSPRDSTASNSSNCNRPALKGNLRYLASPQITVDASGVLHVVYSYDPDGFNTGDVVNVYYRRSTNSGSTWSTQVKLNDDSTTRDQFFPTIQAQGNTLMATWYDRRNDTNNLKIDYYKRISTDGGVTWQASQRLTDLSSSVVASAGTATCYHGDYDQSIVLPNRTEVAQWSDDRSGNADVYTDAASDIATCVVDVATGTSNCSGAITYSGGVAQMNLASGFVRLDALVDVCNPTGMVAHIADSPTSDGFGGDGFTTVHNAETQLFDTSYMFFGMDDVNLSITDPVTLEKNTVPASGCYRVHFVILEDQVLFDDDGVTTDPFKVRLDSYRGFEVGPYNEADAEDPTGANANLWYAAFNRTVSYRADRVGTGASRACLVLSRTTAPDMNLISSLCQ